MLKPQKTKFVAQIGVEMIFSILLLLSVHSDVLFLFQKKIFDVKKAVSSKMDSCSTYSCTGNGFAIQITLWVDGTWTWSA